MKKKVLNFIEIIKTWSLRRKVFYGVLCLFVIFIIFKILSPKDYSSSITTDIAKITTLKQTVLATGQVTSNTDLNLSFNASGIVKSIKVKVGDKVKEGQVLATLDNGNVLASLTSARGALLSANARYKKTVDGASSEEVALGEVALSNAKNDLENTKLQQDSLVNNAYKTLLNSTPEALPLGSVGDYTAPTISGTYNLGKEGDIQIKTYYTGNGAKFSVSGIVSGEGQVTTTTPQPIGNSGLYIVFSSTTNIIVNDWVVSIPNKKAANYLTNYNAYQSALKTRESTVSSARSLVSQREAELAIKKSGARGGDIDLAKADIISAEGQVQAAQANYNNTIITAPANGTITSVDIKYGELATAQKEAIILQDVDNLYIEANINETNIAALKLGQDVTISYDAFGTNEISYGKVYAIDPSSTVKDGIVNYKIKVSLNEKNVKVLPGMNANINIKIFEKEGVLVIPKVAVHDDMEQGTSYVNIITNTKRKTYKKAPVIVGQLGDGNLVEVSSGLKEGDEVVILDKSK